MTIADLINYFSEKPTSPYVSVDETGSRSFKVPQGPGLETMLSQLMAPKAKVSVVGEAKVKPLGYKPQDAKPEYFNGR